MADIEDGGHAALLDDGRWLDRVTGIVYGNVDCGETGGLREVHALRRLVSVVERNALALGIGDLGNGGAADDLFTALFATWGNALVGAVNNRRVERTAGRAVGATAVNLERARGVSDPNITV
ncbi:hypothetical protein I5L51_00075 [Pseudomonas mendocina]|nr:hypothetical protein [Pseudomonas mendocina]MBH3337506.1 hypothetical protein [Pseudomonas mendocina]